MEFPDLGKQCSEATCKQLDFLPLKCDACEQIFCKDHISYAQHSCTSAYKKDVQVPVCPLCNTPIPLKRGETADGVVGEHIDRECKSDPARQKRKIFTNKCGKPGCKQKEMMKVTCDQCHGNFCLKHRHPLDHDCKADGPSLSKAGHAAMRRAQRSSSKSTVSSSRPAPLAQPQHSQRADGSLQLQRRCPTASLQDGLSEEAALQRALEISLTDSAMTSARADSSQEEEDLALAQAISASEEEYRRQQQQQQHPVQNRNPKASNCILT